ncbi:MAG: hypothetical protein H6R07_1178 [Proteobacteria bacterium]|nr:hypothetical protein [Pseudomonadota bacterium]
MQAVSLLMRDTAVHAKWLTPYVQHNLLAQSREGCEWIKQGAQILICGNTHKIPPGVDKALRRMLGSEQVDLLF